LWRKVRGEELLWMVFMSKKTIWEMFDDFDAQQEKHYDFTRLKELTKCNKISRL